MATVILQSYPAARGADGNVQIEITRGGTLFPQRKVDVGSTAEALAALAAYRGEAEAVGAPMAVSIRLAPGSRAPRGFNTATERPPFHPVNV